MAIGDKQDIYNRLCTQLPQWFGADRLDLSDPFSETSHPVLDALLQAFISTADFHYNTQYLYVQLQTRIKTATDINLDLIAQDFFGDNLPRRPDEADDNYRNRILASVLQEKCTRRGLFNALLLLTGNKPILFEPWRYFDTGAYNVPSSLAYNTHGKYGSGSYPYQGFADVFLPPYQGMAQYPGYNVFLMGYSSYSGNATGWYGNQSLMSTYITDSDVYKLINLTKVFGTIVWTRIHREGTTPVNSFIYDNDMQFITDNNGVAILDG